MSVRMWRVATAVGVVAILVGAWVLLIGPQRAKAAELEVEAASQEAASEQLVSKISLLKKQSQELPAQEAKLAAIQQRIPSTTSIPTLIRNLSGLASGASVTVTALDPARPAPVVVAVPEPVAPAADDPDAPVDTDATADDEAEAAPAPPQPTVEAVGLSISVCGDFAQIRNYLGELEGMRRVVAVSGLSISKTTCDGSEVEGLQANISASAFTMPDAASSAASGATSAMDPNAATTGAS